MKTFFATVAGQPFVQFLVLGVVFFSAYALIGGPGLEDEEEVIRVTNADISRLDASWQARWNRPPTEEELDGLVRNNVEEIALYRHAVVMGLDKNDAGVRRMLGQKLKRLTQNLIELSLSPTEPELEAYFIANIELYRAPAIITFTHIFIDPDLREETTLDDAQVFLGELRALAQPTEGIDEFGDPFMLQRYYPGKTELEISKQFGQGFTQSVFKLSPGEWHGPVLSGYGVHLVYVHHLEDSVQAEFSAVRDRVKQDWMDEKRKEFQEAYVEEVLASYEVVIDDSSLESADPRTGTGQEGSE